VPVEMVHYLLKLLLKQSILAVYHDFRWLLVASKLLTAKRHSCYVMLRSWRRESVGHFGKVELQCIRSRTFYLRLRNPGRKPDSYDIFMGVHWNFPRGWQYRHFANRFDTSDDAM